MKKTILLMLFLSIFSLIQAQTVNRSLSFDGNSSTKVVSGDILEVNGVSQISVDFWVYIDQWVENSFIYKKQGSTWQTRLSMSLGTQSNKRLYFHFSNGSNKYYAVDNSAISVGAWHHIAMTFDGSQSAYNQVKIYVDGNITSGFYSTGNGLLPTLTPSSTGDFTIGENFKGKIDEFRLWSVALSQSQLDLKNTISQYHPLYGNLICYYRGDQSQITNVADYVNKYPGMVQGNVTKPAVVNNTVFNYSVVMAYVRENLFQRKDIISNEYLLNNNDIIMFGSSPTNDGNIYFDYPDNDGTLSNTNFLSTYNGRNGVLDFTGSGSSVNCGKGLLLKGPDAGSSVFTFESWVYIDTWQENSYIFKKESQDWLHKVDIQLGPSANKRLYFHFNNGSNVYAAVDNAINVGGWYHLAVAYNGTATPQLSITINGVAVNPWFSSGNGTVSTACPNTDGNFVLGENFSGKLDEVRLWKIFRTPSQILGLMNSTVPQSSWDYTMLTGYWKVDDSLNPAKDLKNIKHDLEDLNNIFNNTSGATKRLGIGAGNFQTMIQTDAARKNFAHNVKQALNTYNLDGVDLDFEWCTTTQQWSDYSQLITTINDSIPSNKIFSVTLHPLYYNISTAAINALDMISIQFYGPGAARYPYNQFVTDYNTVTNYGLPFNKLVLGLPFIGTLNTGSSGGVLAYKDIVAAYPSVTDDPSVDFIANYNGGTNDMTFNGVNTITQKTKFIKDNFCKGGMYWDTATDVNYSSQKCLLRAFNSIINSNIEIPLGANGLSKFTQSIKSLNSINDDDSIEIQGNKMILYPNPAEVELTISVQEPIKEI